MWGDTIVEEKYEHESKYNIIEKPKSFIITSEREDRVNATIKLTDDYHFLISPPESRDDIWISSKVDLFKYQNLTSNIPRIIMFDWERPEDEDNWWPGLKSWVNTQTSKALNSRIHDQWERLLNTIDDDILDVHKAMYAHVFTQPEVLNNDNLYKHDSLVQDIQDYQACAIALQNLDSLGKKFLKRTKINNLPNPISIDEMDFSSGSSNIVDSHWSETSYNYRFKLLKDNWRRFLSYSGKMYDELNKTIKNLPGNLPHKLVSKLSITKLKRPLTNRLEFLTYMSAVDTERKLDYLEPFMFAEEDNIKKAIDLYNKNEMREHQNKYSNQSDLKYGKTAHISQFVKFVLNNSVITEGNIIELTNNAIDQVVIEKM